MNMLGQYIRIVGGALLAPRRVMSGVLAGDPAGLNQVLALLGLQVLALQLPELVRAGWFMAAVDARGGASMMLQAVSQPLLLPLLGALAGSVVLSWTAGGEERSGGRSLDLAALAAVPYLVLQAAGAVAFKLLGPLGLSPVLAQGGTTLLGGLWFLGLLALAGRLTRTRPAGAAGAGEGEVEGEGEPRDLGSRPGQVVAGWGATGLVLLVLCFNLLLVLLVPEALRPVARGSAPPALELPSLEGQTVTLKQYQGKAVLVSFWASWCSPCMREMPFLSRLQQELGPGGLQVLAVNVEGNADLVRRVAGRQPDGPGLRDLKVLLDDGRTAARFGVRTLPHLVLLDRSGRVDHVQIGGGGEAEIQRRARAAVGPKPAQER